MQPLAVYLGAHTFLLFLSEDLRRELGTEGHTPLSPFSLILFFLPHYAGFHFYPSIILKDTWDDLDSYKPC